MSTHLLHLKSGLNGTLETYIKKDQDDDEEDDDDEHQLT